VTRDHAAQWVSATLGEGATALRLDRLSGETAAPLHVAVYPERLPAPWLLALAIATVVLAAIADARLGVKDQGAAGAGIALAFGILVTRSATPQGAVGEAFASLAVALFAGGLAGWIAGLVARRLVPAARRERRGGAGA
jgi:hypothetical protein